MGLPKLTVREFDGGWGVFEKGGTKPVATGKQTTLKRHVKSVKEQEKES